jgi:hypothetical protein
MKRCRGKTVIEAASHHLRLPMGIHAYGIPAIRLHGISMQHAKDVVQIIPRKLLQYLPPALIPATPRSGKLLMMRVCSWPGKLKRTNHS